MKFGIAFANIITFAERDGLTTLARGAEAAGFDSLWTVEHVIYPEGYESTYPYDPSGKMAMTTDTPNGTSNAANSSKHVCGTSNPAVSQLERYPQNTSTLHCDFSPFR